jgi:hypothetical protein
MDTKILLQPQPESKRQTKIIDTKYTLEKVEDLMNVGNTIMESLKIVSASEEEENQKKDNKRFEDMT